MVSEPQFRVLAGNATDAPVVLVSGDVDLCTVEEFSAAMEAVVVDVIDTVTVDMRAVTYCDSAALRVLFAAASRIKLTVTIREAGPVAALLRISGLDRITTVVTVD